MKELYELKGEERSIRRVARELGNEGGYTTLKDYVQPRRRPRAPRATVRFETDPREQAKVRLSRRVQLRAPNPDAVGYRNEQGL